MMLYHCKQGIVGTVGRTQLYCYLIICTLALLIVSSAQSSSSSSSSSSSMTSSSSSSSDEVITVPGALEKDKRSRQYSGFLDISDTKHVHYYYIESERDPLKDPVVFWTNGGPGCSGMLGKNKIFTSIRP